jgi:membrane protease YdiL (CAAX protease family)
MSTATAGSESRQDGRWIAVFVATMVVAVIVSYADALFVGQVTHRRYYDSAQLSIQVAARETAALAVLWLAASRYLHASPADFGFRYPRFREIALGVVVALVFAVTISLLIVVILPNRRPDLIYVAIVHGTLPWRLALLFFIGIYSPIVQEVVFRGLLLTSLVRPLGMPAAVVASSAIFGVIHAGAGLASVVDTFAIGIVLSVLYLRFRSLTAPIAAHVTTNFLLTASHIVLLGQAGR